MEFELLHAGEAPTLHTVELALKGPSILKKSLLERALVLLREGRVLREPLRRRLFREAIDAGLASKAIVNEIASNQLLAFANSDPPAFAFEWFSLWASFDLPAAWQWVEEKSPFFALKMGDLKVSAAEALEGSPWAEGLSGKIEETKTLVNLFRFLSTHSSESREESPGNSKGRSLMRAVWNRIPGILASLQGPHAQNALQKLAAENAGTQIGSWFLNQATEQASVDAEREAYIAPVDLQRFGEIYTMDPRSEGNLFDQVLARLEEIREGVEGGPFSDRVLFAPGMEEKHLQIWLAARLDDTPRRRFIPRFVVSREPQVDDDKRTDVEASCAAGKVCIEIKPLDSSRGYSANTLTGTLRDQLVGKYLKGRNSKHGVLVLIRLDNKKWQIPDGPDEGNFEDLLTYLQVQANQIKAQSANVERILVFGINCAKGD
jgi:hypothetical protein